MTPLLISGMMRSYWLALLLVPVTRHFVAGVDIKDMLPFIKKTANKPWQQPTTVMRGLDLWKPLIAALNGLTLGGGLETD